jgi:hypothetical protein
MFSTYRKLQLNFSTIPMLKITELGFCLAFPWPDSGLSLRLNCDRTSSILDHFVMQAIFAMGTASVGSVRIAESYNSNNFSPQ